jgi:hypothetical protein
LEVDSFDGITKSDEPWFHYLYELSAMLTRSPGDVIPRMRKEIDVKQTMFIIFVPNRKLLITENLPSVRNSNKITSFQIFRQSWNQKKRDISGGSKVELFTCILITKNVTIVAKFKKNSIRKASYAVLIHLIRLI